MRRTQGIEAQLGGKRFLSRDLGPLENAGEVRIGNDLLDDSVAAFGIGVRAAITQGVIGKTF
jgi:hypothetical protein